MKKHVLPYIRSHRHVLMFLYLPIYLICFFILEQLIVDNYWVSYLPLDDLIPFVPAFIVPYVLWYPAVVLPAFLLYFADTDAFKRYGWYMIVSFSLTMVFYAVFPNGQNLRPALPQDKDFFTAWVALIYAADTNTNVLPSLHVVGCLGSSLALLNLARFRKGLKRWLPALLTLEVLIAISTVFVKQHSVLDILAGIVFGALIAWPLYGRGRAQDKKAARGRRTVRPTAAPRQKVRDYT